MRGAKIMQVLDVLDERIIDLNAQANNKEEVLTLLSKKLKNAGYIDDVEGFKKDIYLRESEGTTGIGNYIAIPHGKSDSVTQVGIAIAKLDHEIEWETLDGKGVKLIFLFAVSNNHEYARNHMLLLADIARKLGNDEAVERMLNATTVEDLKSVFA
jgi:fructose PTS system EIIA component